MRTKTNMHSSYRVIRWTNSLILLIAMAGWLTCGTSYADTIIGSSPEFGFQSWTVSFNNLNTNGAPYWDYPTHYPVSNVPGFPPFATFPPGQFANVGFCLTGTLNCPERFLNPGPAPGSIPFWGMHYDSVADTGGGRNSQMLCTGPSQAAILSGSSHKPSLKTTPSMT